MDFFNQMEVLSLKTSELLDHIHTEASTRSALVEPRAISLDGFGV